jgi:hypothetical protein
MSFRHPLPPVLCLALCCLGGCALVYEGRYDYDQGWRLAAVQAVGAGDTRFGYAGIDCRGPAAQGRYAYVQYHSGHHQHHAVVPIADGLEVAAGRQVYANIQDCALPAAPVTGNPP